MLLWLQTHASQEGFWIAMGAVAVIVLGAAIYFRPDGEPDRFTLKEVGSFLLCVLIALAAWYGLALITPIR